jgi:hypothetical protein
MEEARKKRSRRGREGTGGKGIIGEVRARRNAWNSRKNR